MKKTIFILCCLFATITFSVAFISVEDKGKNVTEIKSKFSSESNALNAPAPPCCIEAGADRTLTQCGKATTLGHPGTGCNSQWCSDFNYCPDTYSWSPSTYLSCTNCAKPVFTSPCTGSGGSVTYTLTTTGTNPTCGPNTDVVTVTYAGCCGECCRIGQFHKDEELENKDIKLFPNPNTGIFTIEFGSAFANAILKVYDMGGMLVQEQKVNHTSIQIDLKNRAKGLYYVQVTSGEKGLFHKKVFVE